MVKIRQISYTKHFGRGANNIQRESKIKIQSPESKTKTVIQHRKFSVVE